MSLLSIFNNRDSTLEICIKDADDALIVLQPGDFIRVKIGHEPHTPILDIKGGVATSNGSGFPAATNPFTLTLKRADVAKLGRGIWNLEAFVYDVSALHAYHADFFQLEVRGTQAGEVA